MLFVTSIGCAEPRTWCQATRWTNPTTPRPPAARSSQWVVANRGDLRGPQGLPIWKPPYSRIIAIDMRTGEFLWETPNGDSPDIIRNHPAAQGPRHPANRPDGHAIMLPTKTLLLIAPPGGVRCSTRWTRRPASASAR